MIHSIRQYIYDSFGIEVSTTTIAGVLSLLILIPVFIVVWSTRVTVTELTPAEEAQIERELAEIERAQ